MIENDVTLVVECNLWTHLPISSFYFLNRVKVAHVWKGSITCPGISGKNFTWLQNKSMPTKAQRFLVF